MTGIDTTGRTKEIEIDFNVKENGKETETGNRTADENMTNLDIQKAMKPGYLPQMVNVTPGKV